MGKQDNQIVVKEQGRLIHSVVAERLRQIVITGGGSISFEALNLLAENGVDVIVVNWKGDVTARLSSPEMRTVSTRREQYFAYNDKRSGHIAKNIVLAKIKNQYALIGTWAKTRKETNPEGAEHLMKLREQIGGQLPSVEGLPDEKIDQIRGTLMGIEGSASALYWQGFSSIIPEKFGFRERGGIEKGSSRNAVDPVNAMLNYAYGILEGEVWRNVHFAGLDPYGGFLHVDRPGKPSMVLDLMEEFRQQVVDKSVLALVTKKVVSPDEFQMVDGMYRLADSARKAVVGDILQRFEDYLIYRDEKMRWCDLVLKQARMVAQYLRGEATAYDGFYLRW